MGGKHSNTRTNYIHIAPSSAHQSMNNVKDFVFYSAGTVSRKKTTSEHTKRMMDGEVQCIMKLILYWFTVL